MRLVFPGIQIVACLVSIPLFAEPAISKCKTEFYDIEGDSSADLLAELKAKNGTKSGHFAYTSYSYKINCKTLKTTCKVRLPRWVERPESQNAALNEKWDKFYEALVAHEQGHVDIFRRAMRPAKEKIQSMPCAAAQKHATAEFNRQSAQQKMFDAETKHGMLKGAVFAPANYLAIAYSETQGAVGYAYDMESETDATSRAVTECAAHDCKSLTWANGGKKCISLVTGENKGYGFAWADGRPAAENKATAGCTKRTKNCKVQTTVCAGQGKVSP